MTPFVPVQTAADALARSVNTLRTWARRSQIRSQRDPETGELLVHWLDVRRLDDTRRERAA